MAIQEAVNKAITTGASFILASQELKNRRAKEQKAQMQTAEAVDQRMKEALARRKQEAEAVKARSEEFRKLVMEGTPQYGHGPREVIRYGN